MIKERLAAFAAELFKVAPEDVTFRDDRVFAGNESIGFGELAHKAHLNRIHLSAAGFYKTPEGGLGPRRT